MKSDPGIVHYSTKQNIHMYIPLHGGSWGFNEILKLINYS